MLSSTTIYSVMIPAVAVFTGVLVPWAGMRMMVPALRSVARTVRNYRGREVCLGLGLVWVFWTAGSVAFAAFIVICERIIEARLDAWLSSSHLLLAFMVFGGFVFGLIDDAFGNSEHRGFRGHLAELTKGRLTTGSLKLFGIGVLSFAGGAIVSGMRHDRIGVLDSIQSVGPWLSNVLPAAVVIALGANTINLLDVRPGRALKGYLALSFLGIGLLTWFGPMFAGTIQSGSQGVASSELLALTAFVIGPATAVWRYDLGECCMLGDAGANAAGMCAATLVAISLPPSGLLIVAAILLGLNLASERVSFSAVIERTRPLAWLDSLGRLQDAEAKTEE